MSDITTVKQHLDTILAKLQQEQTIPVVDHAGITTTTTVDMRNFAQHFLSNHVVTTVNQYGMITYNYSQYAITKEWHNHEIPYYDDEERYTPSETTPPPETCMATTWEEYSDIRCEVATTYVTKMMESICLGIDMYVKYQAMAVDVVKVILDGVIAVLATGTVVVTAGGGAPISIPVGLALGILVEIITLISKFITETVGELIKSALNDPDHQQELICAIYENKTPEAIKTAWDAKIDEIYTGIPMFPIRKLLQYLMPNRHAFALAEGAGVRSIGADCGGCMTCPTPTLCVEALSVLGSHYAPNAYGIRNWDYHKPSLFGLPEAEYPSIFAKPSNEHWTYTPLINPGSGYEDAWDMWWKMEDGTEWKFRPIEKKIPGGTWQPSDPPPCWQGFAVNSVNGLPKGVVKFYICRYGHIGAIIKGRICR